MEDAHAAPSTRRYVLVAVFVALLGILATVLLTALVAGMEGNGAIAARVDSPRVHGARDQPRATRHLTLAIAPVTAPREQYTAWARLAALLERELGVDISLVHRGTYAEINELLDGPTAVIAMICSGPYVRARRRGAVQLLAIPRVHGRTDYRSHILVPADSPARTLADLRGHTFGMSDPLSNSGALYPRFAIRELGAVTDDFFDRIVFTRGHDRSIRAVAAAMLDGAAVDSLVYDWLRAHEPAVTARVRIIDTSGPMGMNPIVANQRIPRDLADRLRSTLLALGDSDDGRAVLAELGFDELAPGNPADYRSIEAMLRVVEP